MGRELRSNEYKYSFVVCVLLPDSVLVSLFLDPYVVIYSSCMHVQLVMRG